MKFMISDFMKNIPANFNDIQERFQNLNMKLMDIIF